MKKFGKLLAILLTLVTLVSVISLVVSGAEASSTEAKEQIINESLVMKVGTKNALSKGSKITLVGAPYEKNGVVMLPISDIKSFASNFYPSGSYTNETVDGVKYIGINDVEKSFFTLGSFYGTKYYVTYDSVNKLVFISTVDEFVNSTDDAELLRKTSKRLVIDELINESLVMKVNSGNSLLRGVKTELVAEPYKENGVVMVPLSTVTSYTGKNPSGSYTTATKGGVTFIAMNDIESAFADYYVTYDEVGLIFILKDYDNFINRNEDELLMQDTAKRFIYTDTEYFSNFDGMIMTSSSPAITDISGHIGNYDFTDFVNLVAGNTSNFTHPYILADQNKFDELNRAYSAKEGDADYDEELAWYIQTQIEYADTYLKKYANLDNGNYVGLKEGQWKYNSQGMASWDTTEAEGNHSVSKMPYTEDYAWMDNPDTKEEDYDYYRFDKATGKYVKGYGYDPAGGRLNVLSDGESCLVAALEPAALAYQITRDEKYLNFAYDWMVALCAWEHWGPGHYLNCANTSRPLATAYDWLYNGFVEKYGQDAVDYIAKRIYENGVYEATVSLTNNAPEHARSGDSNSSRYWGHVGNWNSCGTLGMLIASLAVIEHEEYRQDASYVIAASLGNYMERGMTYVTFDGGYRESAGYWGCVRFMHFTTKIVMDTMGTDLGLRDFPGIDITDYFGCHLEGSDYNRWNYHDDWTGTQPSYWYYLSADLFDNPEYAAIRYNHIHSGNANKAPFRYDLLFYDKKLVDSVKDVSTTLALDNVMTSIDAVVSRSSWESGALYAGLMGGRNNVAHGQYDSGNWIYENGGIRWFVDLGADDYNLAGGGLATGYYKYSAEGNNTLALGSLPHGQRINKNMDTNGSEAPDGGDIISSVVNEYGTATILDQTLAYNGYYKELSLNSSGSLTTTWYTSDKVDYAYRGMLLTNSRTTTVIQDEVKLNEADNLYWFAHYSTSTVLRVTLSEDSKTAYMWAVNSNGEFQQLRVSLISDNANLKFEIMDTYTYLLDTPNSTDAKYASYWQTNAQKGTVEGNRNSYRKLAVKAENVTELNMAVVIELLNSSNKDTVGYTYTSMSSWVPEKGDDAIGDVEQEKCYTLHYSDGTSEDFYTTKLSEGLVVDPTASSPSVKSNVVRLECHTTVVADVSINIPIDQHLTIDLNGNILVQKSTFRVGFSASDKIQSGTLTINDGEWAVLTLNGFQLRYGTTLTMNGVRYVANGYFIRDEGANVVINNSYIEATNHLFNVNMVSTNKETDGRNLIFNNSEVKYGTYFYKYETASLSATYGSREVPFYQIMNVYLMGNTKLSLGKNDIFFFNTASGNTTPTYIPGVHNFYIEDGVKLSKDGVSLPASGEYVNPDESVSNLTFTLNYRTGMSYENGTLDLGDVLYSGNEAVISAPYGEGAYKYVISANGEAVYAYTVDKTALAPYFAAYMKDQSVVEYYTPNITGALPTNYVDNGVYKIVLYRDSTVATDANLGNAQQLLIDLGGNTLTAAKRITIGSSVASPITASVTVVNGNYVKTSGDGFVTRYGTKLVFDGVDIDSKGRVAWDNGASLISFNNCNVTSSDYLIYERFYCSFDEGDHVLVFNNTTLNVNAILYYEMMTSESEYLDIYVLGDSVLDYSMVVMYTTNTKENYAVDIANSTYNAYVAEGALIPYADFGWGEQRDNMSCSIKGCSKVVIADDYTIAAVNKITKVDVVASGEYFTVAFVKFVKGVKSSLTLYTDFTINFFLPVKDNVIEKVVVGGIEYIIDENAEIYTEGGVSYYKIAIKNIAASCAADDLIIDFYSDGMVEEKTFSVVKYCEILFSDIKFFDTYALAAASVNYIDASYEYTGAKKPAALENMLDNVIYKTFAPEYTYAEKTKSDTGNLGVAIRSVQLDLGASLNFRFNLKSDFSGTIVINGSSYIVENGMSLNMDYINVSMRAYDMYDPDKCVVISGMTDGGVEFAGSYDLARYINGTNNASAALERLLGSLYTYCMEAYENKYGVSIDTNAGVDAPDAYVEIG